MPGRVRLGIRRRSFPPRVVEAWHSLPREASRPQPGNIQAALGQGPQRHGVNLVCPVQGQELDSMILVGPFQLRTFYDSMKKKHVTKRREKPSLPG